jgi:hypothetical protein
VPGEALSAEKTVQLKIDALKEAAARPGAGRRTLVVPASQLMAAELCQEGHPPKTVRRAWARSTERKRNEHPESIPRR